jgi:pimeloyl-ACP methyl ester carboxylesterase
MTAPDPGMAVPAPSPLLAGFERGRMDVDGVTVNHAIGGAGPLLLLHGYPENHLMWRHVAPVLAEDHTVVLANLRGYGDSGKPAPDAAGLVYAKRSMAGDQAGLMRQLGFGQFGLIGHDRGARVAHRLVLDHPGAVTRLAVLDIVPTRHVLGNVTGAMASAYSHWFFLATPNGVPERMIAADPGFWVWSLIGPPGRDGGVHPHGHLRPGGRGQRDLPIDARGLAPSIALRHLPHADQRVRPGSQHQLLQVPDLRPVPLPRRLEDPLPQPPKGISVASGGDRS